MCAWGDVAVGEQRPSAGHPSKSAVLGVLAAALGIRCNDEAQQQALSAHYAMAVRVDATGELLRDYHTAQVPPSRRGVRYYTRRDELRSDKLNTILSQRDYRMDASYSIAIWSRNGEPPWSMAEMSSALLRPRFTLYLGRKSCPLALPLQPRLTEAETLRAAFDEFPCRDALQDVMEISTSGPCYWEGFSRKEAGFNGDGLHMVYHRRDQVLSRKRWQFAEREEHYYAVSPQEG